MGAVFKCLKSCNQENEAGFFLATDSRTSGNSFKLEQTSVRSILKMFPNGKESRTVEQLTNGNCRSSFCFLGDTV